MSAIDPQVPVEEASARRPPSIWHTLVTSAEGRIGLVLTALMLLIVIVGPFVAPYPPDQIGVCPPLAQPSVDHPLGCDQLGRDVFSRVLSGGTGILFVPVAAVALAVLIGGLLGMLAAYSGGSTDSVISRTFDVLMAVPPLLIVLVLIAGLGSSPIVMIVTVALVFVPRVGRVVKGSSQAVVTSDFVQSAQARGERTPSILVREILPNISAPVIADTALRITYAIIFIATLNFLGLGAQPPSPDWGLMVAESRKFITVQPWATIGAATCIALLSIAFNFIADALTRHLARSSNRTRPQL